MSTMSLDEVPWSTLWHAYGSAADVPEQIRALLDADAKVRQKALYSFTCNIYHQGSRYPATVAAIPFFVELLQTVGVAERVGILDLLVYLAVGSPDSPITRKAIDRMVCKSNPLRTLQSANDQQNDMEIRAKAILVDRECYVEVAAGCPVYAGQLESEDEPVAIAAAFLLAFFPLHAFSTGEKLLNFAQDTQLHSLLRAGCLMSLGYLRGANATALATNYCETLVANPLVPDQPVPIVAGAATFYLLSMIDDSLKIDCDNLKRIADACLTDGIEQPVAEFYETINLNDSDEIETLEEYYEEFLAPVPEFPWSIEDSIQQLIRQRFTRSN